MNETAPTSTFDLATKIQASKDVLAAELGGEISLLNVNTGIYFTLNPVGASVWRRIQKANSLLDIRQKLVEEYSVDVGRCETDLNSLVKEMLRLGLIEFVPV
jgi:hypothetical protein